MIFDNRHEKKQNLVEFTSADVEVSAWRFNSLQPEFFRFYPKKFRKDEWN